MSLKMKELTKLSGESKSTILFYIKEGLLPEPKKPKPNLHLYSENSIEIIKFIKYLQNSFGYSIADIKEIFKNNSLDFDSSFASLVKSIEILQGGKDSVIMSKNELIDSLGIKKKELDTFIDDGLIYNSKMFNKKDIEAIKILIKAKELGLDFELFKKYASFAKELAIIENSISLKLLEDDTISHNSRYEFLFDTILNYKPYIFNSYTIKEHKTRISND